MSTLTNCPLNFITDRSNWSAFAFEKCCRAVGSWSLQGGRSLSKPLTCTFGPELSKGSPNAHKILPSATEHYLLWFLIVSISRRSVFFYHNASRKTKEDLSGAVGSPRAGARERVLLTADQLVICPTRILLKV